VTVFDTAYRPILQLGLWIYSRPAGTTVSAEPADAFLAAARLKTGSSSSRGVRVISAELCMLGLLERLYRLAC